MNKTYITEMPNQIGAFLQASRCFAKLGINITRVSYNKAVDSHMLFIDAEGTEEQLQKADEMLEKIGYLPKSKPEPRIVLIEFKLRDVSGVVTSVLELIEKYHFNISYINSSENGTGFQLFKMGLVVDDNNRIGEFIRQAETLCTVRIIDYNHSEKVFDNSFFYRSFISGLTEMMSISKEKEQELLVNANTSMQTLDEKGLSPYKVFDSIYCFTKLLSECRGDVFKPRISKYEINANSEIILIEPACGSNTAILKSNGKYLFIDSGYACYKDEMVKLFNMLIPDFDVIEKNILITHADVDHCGLLPMFDNIYASSKSAECLRLEFEGKNGFREQNPLHKPYIRMCKILTMYEPPERVIVPWNKVIGNDVLEKIGTFDFEAFHFTVYEGKGGHLPGEIVLIDNENKVAFTGDIFVNIKDMTPEQRQYNRYAPILMTSVDTNSALCAEERKRLFGMLDGNNYKVFGAHGAMKEIKQEQE